MKRPLSLRTRVALASAATAAVVVGVMSAVGFAVAPTDARSQVGTVVEALAITRADGTTLAPGATVAQPVPGSNSPGAVAIPTLPSLPPESVPAVRADGTDAPAIPAVPLVGYERTVPVDGKTVVLAVPREVVAESATKQRTRIIVIGVTGTLLAALLGWYFASRAVAPLRRLTAETAGLGDRLELEAPKRSVASETSELASAMNSMLGRIAEERRHTSEALVTARDFAATAAHELRTPLTAMRTDLQVLRTMPLSESDRTEILDEVLSGQKAIETTLYALERLAVGDLTTESDWEDVDLGQLIDQVVDDAQHTHPDVRIEAEGVQPIRLRGLVAGLRSVIENALTNAVRHGAATRIDIAARTQGDTVELTVDDNGAGVPDSERERVFERFYRASPTPGNGLGLALVAQQARLHGGTATLTESPLGGARLTVTLALRSA